MAKYNTFVVQQTKGGRTVLVTSSARKAKQLLTPGHRIEVWSGNEKAATIYSRTASQLDTYTAAERAYIRAKQRAAETRNKSRRARHDRAT